MFDLVADVERYPEFLRWWVAARILRRDTNVYYTDQILGLGLLRARFGSKTVLCRPRRIDVTSDEPPFRRFELSWRFGSLGGGGCRIRLDARLELRLSLLQRFVDQALPQAVANIAADFEARARAETP